MKIFSKFTLIIILAIFFGCKNDTNSHHKNPEETFVLPKPSDASIKSFNDFFELFNKDSTFQKGRIKFPLRVDQINPIQENHKKNKQVYIEKNDFVILNLIKFENDSNFEASKNVISESHAKFTLREIKTNNYKIFHFTIKDKEWILESSDEISFPH